MEVAYDEKITEMLRIIANSSLTPNEENFILSFVNEYWDAAQVVLNSPNQPDDRILEIATKGKEIINKASTSNTVGSKLIIDTLTNLVAESTKKAQENVQVRRLRNHNMPSTYKEDQSMDIAGFTNAVIIIILAIVVGFVLGAVLFMLNR